MLSKIEIADNTILVTRMILIVMIGLGMFVFGCLMVLRPLAFSRGIVEFSQKPWFHAFEVVSRLTVGVLLLWISEKTSYPVIVKVIGGLLCFVSVFLLLIGSERHRKFALTTSRIGRHFRPIGVIAQVFGLTLVYIGLTGA